MKLVTLPDGYKGHTKVFIADPIAEDGDLAKLAVYGAEHLIRWVHKADLAKAIADQAPVQAPQPHGGVD